MEKLRKSSYTIPIKLEKEDDKYVLLHGYTGAIDIIENELKEDIFSNNDILKGIISYPDEVINKLIDRGYLTLKSKEEEINYVKYISNVFNKRNKLSVKTFTLLVTYNCNFNCPYCYEKESITKENSSLSIISKKMVDNAFSVINKIEPNENLINKTINLFGGEPLLKENKERIKYIVEKGKEHGFSFSATSNGYDLDSYGDLLGKDMIHAIQITIDGSKLVHDSRRIHNTHISTFDRIIDNIKLALEKSISIAIRINVDDENIDEITKLDNYFHETGLYSFENFLAYAEYIGGDINYNPNSYNFNKKQNVTHKDFLDIISSKNINIKHDINLYSRLFNVIKKGKSLRLSPCHCGAQSSSYILDPFGYVYACLETVGNRKEAIGMYNIDIKWTDKKKKWHDRNIGIIEKCSKCKYALLCGGGCFIKSLKAQKKSDAYCNDFPNTLKSAINDIYFRLSKNSFNV